MAVFSTNTLGNLNQIEDKKIQSYLYKLNEDLTYMFNNLTPEDNYSKEALSVYASNSQMVTEMSVTVDGIKATVTDNVNNYNSTLSVLANCLSLTNSTPAGSSSAVLSGDKITLTTGKFLVNSKNLTIDASGNATFSGKVSAAAISGGTITGTSINGGSDIPFKARSSYVSIGDFVVDDTYGRHIFQSYDEVTGMSTGDADTGELLLWAGWGFPREDRAYFCVNADGNVYIWGNLYVNGRKITGSTSGGGSSGGGSTEEIWDDTPGYTPP